MPINPLIRYIPILSPTPHTKKMPASKPVAISDRDPDTKFKTTVVLHSKESIAIKNVSLSNPVTTLLQNPRVLTSSKTFVILEEKHRKKGKRIKKK